MKCAEANKHGVQHINEVRGVASPRACTHAALFLLLAPQAGCGPVVCGQRHAQSSDVTTCDESHTHSSSRWSVLQTLRVRSLFWQAVSQPQTEVGPGYDLKNKTPDVLFTHLTSPSPTPATPASTRRATPTRLSNSCFCVCVCTPNMWE